jgi:hypothetical protein
VAGKRRGHARFQSSSSSSVGERSDQVSRAMITQPHTSKVRHRCRNPRCGAKLKEPTDNPREAFCCKGCFTSYYRNRCIVCEHPYDRTREDQHTCGRRKCKGEFRRHRLRFLPKWGQIPGEALSTTRNPIKSGLKTGIKSLRGWRWERLPDEDDDWHQLNWAGREVARVRREGQLYWISHPSCWPEPKLEDLGQAKRRAELMALWALDPPKLRQQRGHYLVSRGSASERYAQGLTGGSNWRPSPHIDPAAVPDIPGFLRCSLNEKKPLAGDRGQQVIGKAISRNRPPKGRVTQRVASIF